MASLQFKGKAFVQNHHLTVKHHWNCGDVHELIWARRLGGASAPQDALPSTFPDKDGTLLHGHVQGMDTRSLRSPAPRRA